MRSFSARLTLTFALLVTGTIAVVLAAGGWLLNREMINGVDLLHDIEGRELAELIGPDPDLTADEIADRIEHDADSDSALFYIQIHHQDGRVLFRSRNLGRMILPDLSGRAIHWTMEMGDLGDLRISEFHHDPWHLQIASSLESNQRLRNNYFRISTLLVLGVAGVSLVLGLGFSRFTLGPLRRIETTARRISGENLSERIPSQPGHDELANLSVLLNRMFDRLQGSFEQIKRFTADASHELKTPLALIRLNAERLRPRLAGDAEAEGALDELMEEAGRLQEIIDSLLFLAKADSGALALERRPFDPAPLVADLAEDACVLAEDRQVKFSVARNEPGELRGERNLLRQLLLNLVVNAIKASPPNGTVTIESFPEPDGWRIAVTDEGAGLPPERLQRIFDRFVRFDPENASDRGHGLGLAICHGIAELHRGRLTAVNRSDRSGLRVELRLPRD